MITLLVKGTPLDAMAAACQYLPAGTKAVCVAEKRGRYASENTATLEISSETEDLGMPVREWFCDPTHRIIVGFGFPAGSLLHFSDPSVA